MINVEDSVEARISKGGKTFEILVDCEKAVQYKEGRASLEEAVVVEEVYYDAKKGLRASVEELQKHFNTDNFWKIAEIIIKQGHVNLTTEYKTKLREQKLKQIINFLVTNCADPKTGLPHPPQRIMNALNQLKFKVNEFKTVEEQAKQLIPKLQELMPISFKELMIRVETLAQYGGKLLSQLTRLGELVDQDWSNPGKVVIKMKVKPGKREEVERKVNEITRGNANIKIS